MTRLRDPKPATQTADQVFNAQQAMDAERQEAADLARWIEQAKRLPPIREKLVRKVRAKIEAGTYETPAKLRAAVTRMLAEL